MPAWDLLEGLEESDQQLVLAAAERRRFSRQEVVFHEGDLGDMLFLIASGRVSVHVTTPAGDVATLTVLGQGQCFGEMALLKRSSQRTSTVTALEDTHVLKLRRDTFTALRREHPQVDRLLVSMLAARVDRLSVQLVEALYVLVDKRVARRLLDLARVYREAGLPASCRSPRRTSPAWPGRPDRR